MKNTIGSGAFIIDAPFWQPAYKEMIISKNKLETTSHAIEVILSRGGAIMDNEIFVDNVNNIPFAGIQVTNTSRINISRNFIVATNGDGKTDGSIVLRNSPQAFVYCNTTDGDGARSGLLFLENCDGSIVRRNQMDDHARGLAIMSLYGDGVTGQQIYKNNRWNGGTAAEAFMGAFLVSGINPMFFQFSQFKVQDNTSNLWPNPIIPAQASSGPLDWFYYDPATIDPELYCLTPQEEEKDPSKKLTAFEEGLIDGSIEEIEGAEGKYRDIDFDIYYKLRRSGTLPQRWRCYV
ncbi:MAG: hypothetical protein SH848_08025 [Saprospiraceae bacterium]|nr:hypothetical protein [Saprospiraceae bacterium]